MLHRAQQFGIGSRQPRQCSRIQAIIFSPALGDQVHLLGVRHDHFVPQRGQQPTHPRRMRPRLHRYTTPRQATEYLLHGFRCGRQFVFQNNFSGFIQNAVRSCSPKISLLNACIVLIFFIAGLLYLVLQSTSIIGSLSHPAGDRPSHPICPLGPAARESS